jgi:hypothetical protein
MRSDTNATILGMAAAGSMSCDTHVGPLPFSAACSLFLTVESARMGCQENRELYLAVLRSRVAGPG